MMIPWMVYALAIGLAAAAAAELAERSLRGTGRPTRWVWVCALGASVVLPLVLPGVAGVGGGIGVGVGGTPVPGAPLPSPAAPPLPWDAVLAVGWLAGSLVLVAFGAVSALGLRARRRRWRRGELEGARVLISPDMGPAVVGFFRGEIVVPEWVLGWEEADRRMLVAHEREHLEAGDPWLALGAGMLLVLMPWNPTLWLQARRLRHSIEVDCDARVLRRHSDPRRYGLLLLEVGRRTVGAPAPAMAFAERPSSLERRIRAIAGAAPRLRRLAPALATAAAVLVPLAAYALPEPAAPDLRRALAETRAAPTSAPRAVPRPMVSDTPPSGPEPREVEHDVKPEILNASVIVKTLNDHYPPDLRAAGVSGITVIAIFIDETGVVQATRVVTSSGYPGLDRAADLAMRAGRFRPAMNRGQPVGMWIELPVRFTPTPPP